MCVLKPGLHSIGKENLSTVVSKKKKRRKPPIDIGNTQAQRSKEWIYEYYIKVVMNTF